ncbi:hypothetical protein [Amycolatopsis kentuckyensis]|uniref:hypothetical protein n=1 Tax=Amycolatopsis kentuckyensis TaxID=218823 RepID=UPI0035619D43
MTTWADGYGRWYARVNFPGGYGPSHLNGEVDRIRAKARRAIRRELAERGALGPGWQCRVVLVESALDHMNVTHSLTYRER